MQIISIIDAVILGIVEGLTEFLPVSSTGHLILAAAWLDLYHTPAAKAGVDAFQIVIQSGALLAVAGIYSPQVGSILRGLIQRDPAGRRLLLLLLAGFLPAAIIGLSAGSWIKATLFGIGPVAGALAVGGLGMRTACPDGRLECLLLGGMAGRKRFFILSQSARYGGFRMVPHGFGRCVGALAVVARKNGSCPYGIERFSEIHKCFWF